MLIGIGVSLLIDFEVDELKLLVEFILLFFLRLLFLMLFVVGDFFVCVVVRVIFLLESIV